MGMAASQARLLTLTARLHDVEYEAQSIQNAKLQLATQQDEVYDKYLKALDATTLTMAINQNGVLTNMAANFHSLFSANAANMTANSNYVLLNNRGLVVVDDNLAAGYDAFMDSGYNRNAYTFAMYMVYGEDFETATSGDAHDFMQAMLDKINAHLPHGEDDGDSQLVHLIQEIWPSYESGDITPTELLNLINIQDPNTPGLTEENCNALINYFFPKYSLQMFNEMELPDEDVSKFNYYVRMYNTIYEHGGCVPISDYNEPEINTNADIEYNSEWLTMMIQSGQMTIEIAKTDRQGHFSIDGTAVSSDINLSYTNTAQLDGVALAKAEAEYEHEMKMIDKKDKKFDMDLNKLETERSALTKQYDSLKKVVEDNIERTFGIFS